MPNLERISDSPLTYRCANIHRAHNALVSQYVHDAMQIQAGCYIGDVTALHYLDLGQADSLRPFLLAGSLLSISDCVPLQSQNSKQSDREFMVTQALDLSWSPTAFPALSTRPAPQCSMMAPGSTA